MLPMRLSIVGCLASAVAPITTVDLSTEGFVNDTQLQLAAGYSWSGGTPAEFASAFRFDPTPTHYRRTIPKAFPLSANVTKTREGFFLCGARTPPAGSEPVAGPYVAFWTDSPLKNGIPFESFRHLLNPARTGLTYARLAEFSLDTLRAPRNPVVFVVEGTIEFALHAPAPFRAIFPLEHDGYAVAITHQ